MTTAPRSTSDHISTHAWLPQQRLEWLALLAILLLAGALRLGAPHISEFKRDEANLSLLALDLANGRDLPLLGISSSVGFPNAPVSVYLLAIPFLLTSDPTAGVLWIGLLNLASVAVVYALARRYYGVTAALVAALTYAVSPWAVIYSRKIWAQDMLPLFVTLTIASGLAGFVEGRRWGQWAHLPLLAFTVQIHFAAAAIAPVTLWLLLSGRLRLTRAFVGGIALALILTLPYLIGLARAGGSADVGRLATRLTSATSSAPANPATTFGYAFFTLAGTDIHALAGPEQFEAFLASMPAIAYPLFTLYGAALAIAALGLALRALQRRAARSRVDMALLLWLISAPLIFSIPWTASYPHYLIPILPAAYVNFGAAIGDFVRWSAARERGLRIALVGAGALLALTLALQVVLTAGLLSFVGSTTTPGGFGVPLGSLTPARAAVLEAKPADVIVRLSGAVAPEDDEQAVWRALLYDIPSVRFEDEALAVYPAEPTLLLTDQCDDPAARAFSLRPGEGCYALTTRSISQLDRGRFTPVEAHPFANGAQITGAAWDAQQGCLSLLWTTQGRADADYHFAAHFLDAAGARLFDADDLAWPGDQWRAGDTMVRRLCAGADPALLARVMAVRVGMYTYHDTPEGRSFNNVDLVDQAGHPAGQMLELPLIAADAED